MATKKELKKHRERAKKIKELRNVKKMTFEEIGNLYGISKQRAVQIYYKVYLEA